MAALLFYGRFGGGALGQAQDYRRQAGRQGLDRIGQDGGQAQKHQVHLVGRQQVFVSLGQLQVNLRFLRDGQVGACLGQVRAGV